ncbi:MAG TPA: glycoside hydrolase family 6 protein [Marmoricola sp.]|nr:glycoside hydrolase family 6 protein [Marmoricola sp.]
MKRSLIRLVLGAVALALVGISASTSAPTSAAPAGSPLADGPWTPFVASFDPVDQAYSAATGTNKTLLGKIALRPRVIWMTSQTQNGKAEKTVQDRISEFQQGNPAAYTQLALFGLYPKGESHRSQPLSAAQQATYKAWIDQIAAGIGRSRVILILEPDLGVAWGGWRPAVRFGLAAYAAKELGALPNTHVYIDGSDADWLKPAKATTMLRESGIAYADGIALGATHYSSTSSNIVYGADLIRRLASHHIIGKHLVIDTADNGRPFTARQFKKRHPHLQIGNANLCSSRTSTRCVTLGIPPTTDVASTRWGFSARTRTLAADYVDGFLWFGRPWLYAQAYPFKLNRALQVARTTPY